MRPDQYSAKPFSAQGSYDNKIRHAAEGFWSFPTLQKTHQELQRSNGSSNWQYCNIQFSDNSWVWILRLTGYNSRAKQDRSTKLIATNWGSFPLLLMYVFHASTFNYVWWPTSSTVDSYLTMLGCPSSFRRDISLMAVDGTPSHSLGRLQ